MSRRIISRCVVLLLLCFILAITLLVPGCGPKSSEPSTEERSKTVNIAFNAKPRTLDPHNWNDQGSETTIRMCYQTLIYTDHTSSGYTPMLAESWDIAPDGKSWTFYLRKNVFWHNGDPFDADDVVCTFERLSERRNELLIFTAYLKAFESVEKIDQYTVKVNFKEPFPTAGNSFRAIYIIPHKAYEEHGDDLFHKQIYYGTGPWKLAEWKDGEYSHFVKNENYWDKENYDPYFEEVYIRHITQPSSAVAAHVAGDLDVYCPGGGINNDLLHLYAGTEDRIELVTYETNQNVWIGFQFEGDSIWNDINARKAFVAGIDVQLIIDTIKGGKGVIPNGYWHKSVTGYDGSIPSFKYDPELAKELLAQTAYNGEELRMMTNPNLSDGESIGLAIVDMLKDIGFNISFKVEDSTIYNNRRNEGDYDIYLIQTSFVDGVPYRQLNLILNDTDHKNYVNEEMFDLIRQYNVEMDREKSVKLVQQVNRMMCELVAPEVSLFHTEVTCARDYGITGVDFYPDGLFNFSWVDYDPSLVKK